MKKIFLIIFILRSLYSLSGQEIVPSEGNYSTGGIHWRGHFLADTSGGLTRLKQFGLWENWFENGQKENEIVYEGSSTEKFINVWLEDGTQTVAKGNGIYYERFSMGYGEPIDSMVYQIKDSLKNGAFSCYRMYKGRKFCLVETGRYVNSRKTGTFFLRDTVRLYTSETIYDGDNEMCNYKLLHPNFQIKEDGKTINNKKEGSCRFFTNKGVLWKEENYVDNNKFGEYKEYYSDGKIKTMGQYINSKGYKFYPILNADGEPTGDKEKIQIIIPKKSGVWKYYDKNGKLIKTRTF